MKKFLKICNLPQGDSYAPGINLKGNYLTNYGFEVGDMVSVEVRKDEISIKKIPADITISDMMKRNPNFKKLVQELDLTAA